MENTVKRVFRECFTCDDCKQEKEMLFYDFGSYCTPCLVKKMVASTYPFERIGRDEVPSEIREYMTPRHVILKKGGFYMRDGYIMHNDPNEGVIFLRVI